MRCGVAPDPGGALDANRDDHMLAGLLVIFLVFLVAGWGWRAARGRR
jgi:hypothetical protein